MKLDQITVIRVETLLMIFGVLKCSNVLPHPFLVRADSITGLMLAVKGVYLALKDERARADLIALLPGGDPDPPDEEWRDEMWEIAIGPPPRRATVVDLFPRHRWFPSGGELMKLRKCGGCKRDETQTTFSPRSIHTCSECRAKTNKKWREANPERVRATIKAWRESRLLEARPAAEATPPEATSPEATPSVSSTFWESYEAGRGYY